MSIVLYDYQGTAIAYCDDGEHIFTFAGRPAGYFKDGSVYGFAGTHLGRLENGLVRDNQGAVAFFTDTVTGTGQYIVRPIRKIKPLKATRQLVPAKGWAAAKPLKPNDLIAWSASSGEGFFGLKCTAPAIVAPGAGEALPRDPELPAGPSTHSECSVDELPDDSELPSG